MTCWALYNEIDPYAAEWLENLIASGHIAPGIVDRRSIVDVASDGLHEFTQIHWFAGIGGWSLALRRAGFTDDRPIWSASLPCQPFSAAGQQKAMNDDRHLWPVFHNLVRECRPPKIIGEQVSSKPALAWWDVVSNDLQISEYAVGAIDTSVASIGGPHIRQRLYWVADSSRTRLQGRIGSGQAATQWQPCGYDEQCGEPNGVADADSGNRSQTGRITAHDRETDIAGPRIGDGDDRPNDEQPRLVRGDVADSGLAYPNGERLAAEGIGSAEREDAEQCGGTQPLHGPWRDADWLGCTDGKWRPIEPGASALAHGLPRGMGKISTGLEQLADLAGCDARSLRDAKRYRVGSLKGYGNAICVEQAEGFIRAALL